MKKMSLKKLGVTVAAALTMGGAMLACHHDFESPYLPGSGDYAGDDWTRDGNGDGVSDSVEKYYPTCSLPAAKCLSDARIIAQLRISPGHLSAQDMVVWIGDSAALPRLSWSPLIASGIGYGLISSDSGIVMPKANRMLPRKAGSAQITVVVPGDSTLTASFILKVVAGGKRVVSVDVKPESLLVGRDTAPEIIWTPSDASLREYSLQSDKPEVAKVVGQKLRGVSAGKANIVLESLDGGHRVAFAATVLGFPDVIMCDSIWTEEMFLVIGDTAESPVMHWFPESATDKRYRLISSDTGIAGLSLDKSKVNPKSSGQVHVVALTLDGQGHTTEFTVHVAEKAVAVTGLAGVDLMLVFGGEPVPPKLTWLPADATNRKYTLKSSQPTVAQEQGGWIRPLAMGSAEFTVTTQDGGFQGTFLVTVGRPDTSIHVDSVHVAEFSLAVGAQKKPAIDWYPANAGNQSYILTSGDTSVAVPMADKISALRVGQSNFQLVSADGARIAKFKVTVFASVIPVLSVQADSVSLVLGGNDMAPTLIWSPGNSTNHAYVLESSDTNIVAIPGATLLHAKSVGIAQVMVRTSDGPTASFSVVVYTNAIGVVSMAVHNFTLNVGDVGMDVPAIEWNPANATNKNYTLKSVSNSFVLSIVGDKLNALKTGKSALVVGALDGNKPTAVCTVTVVSLTRTLSSRDDTLRLGAADQDPNGLFVWMPADVSNKAYLLKSMDTTVVKIVSGGQKLRAMGGGTTKVTASAQDGSNQIALFTVWVKVPVTGLTTKNVTLKTGVDTLFNPNPLWTFSPVNATDKNWYLTYPGGTPPTSIVKITNGWELTAVGPGSANIIVNSSDSTAIKDTFQVTVIAPVKGVAAINVQLRVGDADVQPALSWNPSFASDKGYTLSGGTAGIATVVGNKMHAAGQGTASFLVTTTDGGKMASFTATVTQPVISVTGISANDMTLTGGFGSEPTAPDLIWTPADATDKGYTLTVVSGISVNIVNGKLNPSFWGISTVRATSNDGGFTATFTVTVN